MALTLEKLPRIGVQTLHSRTEPVKEAWHPAIDL